MNKNFSLAETITTITLFSIGAFIGVRGSYYSFAPNPKNDSLFYEALNGFLPLNIFGYVLLLSALCLMLSSITYGFIRVNNTSNYFMFVGGFVGSIFHFLMATASYNNSVNWLTTWQLGILSVLLGAIGVYSVVDVYAKRR